MPKPTDRFGPVSELTKKMARSNVVADHREAIGLELLALGGASITDVVSWDEAGRVRVKASSELPPRALASIKKIKATEDADGKAVLEVEMHDKVAALRILAKAVGYLDGAREEGNRPSILGINVKAPAADVPTTEYERGGDD